MERPARPREAGHPAPQAASKQRTGSNTKNVGLPLFIPREIWYSGYIGKGGGAIRYVYRPYHPWRHGYRREKRRKAFWFFIRLLLVLELLAAASFYIKRHTVVEVSREAADGPTELEGDRAGEVFGIGIESGGPLFWFHRKTETETAGP